MEEKLVYLQEMVKLLRKVELTENKKTLEELKKSGWQVVSLFEKMKDTNG